MTQKPEKNALPPDHPLVMMRRMLSQSMGRLPTQLVLILALSLRLAVLTGLAMTLIPSRPQSEFLPLRLAANLERPVTDAELKGAWGYGSGGTAMSIRFENGMFEWIVKPSTEKYLRYFIRGNYALKGDVLILAQRPDLGKPQVPVGQIMEFLPYAVKDINLKVETNGKLMLWLVPESERERQNEGFASIFPADPAKPMTWVRLPGR
jgi:hypothetical protein